MSEQRTKSELLFDKYLAERGYDFDSQPRVPGKNHNLDHRVRFDEAEIFFEVKEFEEGEKLPDGAFDPFRRIYLKLKDTWKQLNEYREYCCSVVLYNDSAAPVCFEPEIVLGAMLGTPTYGTKGKEVMYKAFGDPVGFKTGHMIDFRENVPRSTQFSSVIVLEKFPLGQIKAWHLLDERGKHRELKPNRLENYEETFRYIQSLKSEGVDIEESVLRVVVYENPFAALPLPRELFQGPYDERWGSEKAGWFESVIVTLMRFVNGWLPTWAMKALLRLHLHFSKGKITKVFEGDKVKAMEAILRSQNKSPLVRAGLMKEEVD